jgi:hypothetical protein
MLTGFACPQSGTQTGEKGTPHDQTRFGLEEPIVHPVSIPDPVLDLIRKDSEFLSAECESAAQSREKIPANWYEAALVHLSDPKERDFVVKAKNPCLWGPHSGPFWIFRETAQCHKLVLKTEGAGLKILTKRTHGFKDILAGTQVGTGMVSTTYTFDGQTYQGE